MANYLIGGLIVVLVILAARSYFGINMARAAAEAAAAAPMPTNVIQIKK